MARVSFLIAPDKFKGSLSAQEAAYAMAQGVHDIFSSAHIQTIPLADGGDGTALILQKALKARLIRTKVSGPLGGKRVVAWGLYSSTAYLDFASAAGLHLLAPHQRNPLKTTSYGVGELIKKAVDLGAKKIVLGVGGSATVDGGTGAMQALGIRFLDLHGKDISRSGAGLLSLAQIDLTKCTWQKMGIELILLADVVNPLLGKNGAAVLFGPQKGATPRMVQELEKGLHHFNQIIIRQYGKSVATTISGGAAGGAVAGFKGVLDCVEGVKVRVVRGIDYVLDILDVASAIKKTDWIFTGEGQLDIQTLQGKTVHGITALACKMGKPVIAFAGRILLTPHQIQKLGLAAAFAITPKPSISKKNFRHTARWLRNNAAAVTRSICSNI